MLRELTSSRSRPMTRGRAQNRASASAPRHPSPLRPAARTRPATGRPTGLPCFRPNFLGDWFTANIKEHAPATRGSRQQCMRGISRCHTPGTCDTHSAQHGVPANSRGPRIESEEPAPHLEAGVVSRRPRSGPASLGVRRGNRVRSTASCGGRLRRRPRRAAWCRTLPAHRCAWL